MATLHGIVLFSGGLDSLLAAKVLERQCLNIRCLHFTSPFFGTADVEKWREIYDLDIQAHDASLPFAQMLIRGPAYGFGKTLNPCMDCKILLFSLAREELIKSGAEFIATGEVLGQRPMSQRRDSMDIIKREARLDGLLLRPLCAHHYKPLPCEESGLVKREKLYGFTGRSRNGQLELARELDIQEIPSPGGGCVLTEIENGRRYWPVIKKWRKAGKEPDWNECIRDFRLARMGRQFWHVDSSSWLCVGRQKDDNEQLLAACASNDLTLKLRNFPGPIALCRDGLKWDYPRIQEACELLAAHSKRAMEAKKPVEVSIYGVAGRSCVSVMPNRHEEGWNMPDWESTRAEIRR